MINLNINGRDIQAAPAANLLNVLRAEGVRVPTLCHLEGMTPTGACRLCVVEIEGQQRLAPSCALQVSEGMRVQTHSPRAVEARKTIVELLLADHPDDCLYCPRNHSCDLQDIAFELGVRQRRYHGAREFKPLDLSSPAMIREPDKCILCGRCVRVCEEIQSVSAIDFVGRGAKARVETAFEQGLNVSSCVYCGQCVRVCPTSALHEHSHAEQVMAALADPQKTVVIQHAPAVSVTIGEAFNVKGDCAPALTTALRRLGFDRVFDTAYSADLTVMEEAHELVHRVTTGGALPMMTSCSPAWIKFVETFYPHRLAHLSTCKSPQQMLGAVIKAIYAPAEGIAADDIVSVAVMPCTAKKFEAERPEMGRDGRADIDYVLTTRELIDLIRMRGLDLATLPGDEPDMPFGERSGAGKIFGASGGVMESAVRTAHQIIAGAPLPGQIFKAARGQALRKEAQIQVGEHQMGVAVVSSLGEARRLLEELDAGRDDLHFIEIMSCPGGCINGGGQPTGLDLKAIERRAAALYAVDKDAPLRTAHENPQIQALYAAHLGAPGGEISHALLHTHYAPRDILR
ncbi:[FeFe] hydrogenase, group A [Myxococcota bacterium]|nr:[FeFe] hydrogenase, group A [Myxococcota bacterium]MBU1429302.1 [FeFe] hydrogenase, group A [Myxococcota bacterium]MBU1899312.1 [FeFe] hydrogenase, group A [Myxococcota bacterium]